MAGVWAAGWRPTDPIAARPPFPSRRRAQLANEALNIVLKRMLRQTRPQGAEKTDYGMPSDHAQFMFFTATYFALLLLLRSAIPLQQSSPRRAPARWRTIRPRCRANSLAWRCLLSASGLAGAALVAYSR